MSVNERLDGEAGRTTPGSRRRRIVRRALLAVAGAIALVLLFHYVLMPWAVRDRVRAALDQAGLHTATFRVTRATLWATDVRDLVLDKNNRVDRLRVRYNVHDLWDREVRAIHIEGATLNADPRTWPIEKKQAASTTTTTTMPKKPAFTLPFELLDIEDSQIVLADGERVQVRASITRAAGSVRCWFAAPGHIVVEGTLDPSLTGGRATATLENVGGDLVSAMVRTYVADPPVAVSGKLSGRVAGSWGEGRDAHGFAALEITGGSLPNASDAKLTIASGVFVGEANLGPATRLSASVKVSNADLATPDVQARGVGGAVTFVSLDPPMSAPRQKLSAASLTVGQTEFRNGQLEFEVNANGDIFVRQTRWDFLGGQVFANDVRVPRTGPTSFTLTANQIELRDLLATYAKDKVAGSGKISGRLPVVVDGPRIEFGDGALMSLEGGELKMIDPATLAQVAGVAGAAATPPQAGSPDQVKQNVAEALRDFEYDQISARLINEPQAGGLVGRVNIKGHGRGGAKQAIEYDATIRGLDDLLRSYLTVRAALDRPATGKVKP